MHTEPLFPQLASVGGLTHVFPEQQPVPHVAGPHVTQRWALHASPPAHIRQVPPSEPHAALVVPDMHVEPEQQPPAHEVVLHTQLPPTHCWPLAQDGFAPQRQVPPEQLSAVIVVQLVQAAPIVPQALTVGGLTQVVPEQHPAPQVPALQLEHTPAVQVSPPVQAWHIAPDAPHAPAVFPASQMLPLQQPAHDVELQTHAPFEHT